MSKIGDVYDDHGSKIGELRSNGGGGGLGWLLLFLIGAPILLCGGGIWFLTSSLPAYLKYGTFDPSSASATADTAIANEMLVQMQPMSPEVTSSSNGKNILCQEKITNRGSDAFTFTFSVDWKVTSIPDALGVTYSDYFSQVQTLSIQPGASATITKPIITNYSGIAGVKLQDVTIYNSSDTYQSSWQRTLDPSQIEGNCDI